MIVAWWGWTTGERLRFLTRIDREQPAERLTALDQALILSRSGNDNSEIRFAFLDLAAKNRFDPAVPALDEYLVVQSRRKFVRPVIKALAEDQQWGAADRGADLRPNPGFSPSDNDPRPRQIGSSATSESGNL